MALRQSILGIVVFYTYMADCSSFTVTSPMVLCFAPPVFLGLRNTVRFINNPRTATMPLLDAVLKSGTAKQSQAVVVVVVLSLAYVVQSSRDGTNLAISQCNAQNSYSPGLLFLSFFVLTGCMYCQGAEAGAERHGVPILYQCCKTVVYYGMGALFIMVGEPPCTFAACISGFFAGFVGSWCSGDSNEALVSALDDERSIEASSSDGTLSIHDAGAPSISPAAQPGITTLVAVQDTECTMCLSAPRTHAFIPCGHKGFCKDCCDLLVADAQSRGATLQCPTCRQDACGCFRVFDV